MEEIRKKSTEVYEQALKVAQYYVSVKYKYNFVGNGDDFIHKLRSSIQYRVDSVGWHYINLQMLHENAESEHLEKIKNDVQHEHLLFHLNRQYYLFDDIVFNLISLFEYTGNLVGYFWKGEHGKKLKWKGVAKSAMDVNSELSKYEIAKIISDADRTLFSKLEDYRAGIFHYKNQMGTVGTRIEYPSENPIQIQIEASDVFKKIFKGFDIESNPNELLPYSKHAILSAINIILNILSLLQKWEIEPIDRKI